MDFTRIQKAKARIKEIHDYLVAHNDEGLTESEIRFYAIGMFAGMVPLPDDLTS